MKWSKTAAGKKLLCPYGMPFKERNKRINAHTDAKLPL